MTEHSAEPFPWGEGAACLACSRWHRRYGDLGEGALCTACRSAIRGSAGR